MGGSHVDKALLVECAVLAEGTVNDTPKAGA